MLSDIYKVLIANKLMNRLIAKLQSKMVEMQVKL